MTVQERLQLLNFGYTKEQVDAMEAPTVAQPAAQAPTVAQPAAQAPTVAQPAAQAPTSDFLTTLTALGAMLNAQNSQVAQPAAQAPTVGQPTAQAQPTAQNPAPAPTQQATAQPTAPAPVQLSPEQLTQLIQGVAVQTASGTVETPPTAEQSLLKMFEAVAGDLNKE